MGLKDGINYVLFNNPISSGTFHMAKSAANSIGLVSKSGKTITMSPPDIYKLAALKGPYIRLAGVSGAVAVILAAYGSHKRYSPDEKGIEERRIFETASRYHFIHTLSLLSLPLCRVPFLAGTLFISGIMLFCGPCYYSSFTGDKTYSRLTPIGGFCFIMGWLSMCL
ncbi:transmembrane protein 256-like isoform X2 [Leptopilina boulardi]|uniref:transmembrane protein 256-like isoform X2 n=1 Tax=Leptopilina boulardi TaxID=63433 RepID=UPI0021F5AEB9|nr:transmembrane protein 256-like isoform X2 [Leptopilina boulardi]